VGFANAVFKPFQGILQIIFRCRLMGRQSKTQRLIYYSASFSLRAFVARRKVTNCSLV